MESSCELTRMLSCVNVWLPKVFRKGFCAVLCPPPPHSWKLLSMAGGVERSQLLLLYELYVFFLFFCFFWHMNPLHWTNTLWNWSISLTANYTPTGTISLWSIIPSGFILMFLYIVFICYPDRVYIQPDRDYFHTIYYPDRVYSSVRKWVCRDRTKTKARMLGDQL